MFGLKFSEQSQFFLRTPFKKKLHDRIIATLVKHEASTPSVTMKKRNAKQSWKIISSLAIKTVFSQRTKTFECFLKLIKWLCSETRLLKTPLCRLRKGEV